MYIEISTKARTERIRMPSHRHRRLEPELIQKFISKHVDHHILLRLARRFDRNISEFKTRQYLAEVICTRYDSVQHILRYKALPKKYLRQFCVVNKIKSKSTDSRVTLIQKIVHHVRRERNKSLD